MVTEELKKTKRCYITRWGMAAFRFARERKMIAVLEQLPLQVQAYLNPKNNNPFFAEDVFFSVEPQRKWSEAEQAQLQGGVPFRNREQTRIGIKP